jgi:hypothetical protein
LVANLDDGARRRPAGTVLESISWDGEVEAPDAAVLTAFAFLALLSEDA